MCSACFGKKCHASARHVFDMIEKPGASKVRTTASFPSPTIRQRSQSNSEQAQDVAFCPASDGPSRFQSGGDESKSLLATVLLVF